MAVLYYPPLATNRPVETKWGSDAFMEGLLLAVFLSAQLFKQHSKKNASRRR
jgi:hypothetical protein